MALLNYTTTIDPAKTLAEIERRLVAHGARGVVKLYDDRGRPESLVFAVPTAFGDCSFRLPANVEAVEATLRLQCRKGKVPPRLANREQADRVAWRILKDWVEAQMAIIESGMVTIDEVFLPYLLGRDDRTMYQVMRENRLALPAPGSVLFWGNFVH
jgi:hypothetical protein